jgi:hypothetical protein
MTTKRTGSPMGREPARQSSRDAETTASVPHTHDSDLDAYRAVRVQLRSEQLLTAMLDSAGVDNLPDPIPLIERWIYTDSLAWIAGHRASFKTFLALAMAAAVANGRAFLDVYPVKQGSVLYIIAEGASGIGKRKRAWETDAGERMNVTFLPLPVQATDTIGWEALCDVAKLMRPDLIVIDTQARVTVGLDENAKDMGTFVERLEDLRKACGSCVLVLHHTPRNGDHIRGSTALEGAATTIIVAKRQGNGMALIFDPERGGKQKDVQEPEDVYVRTVNWGDSLGLLLSERDQLENSADDATRRRSLTLWWKTFGTEEIATGKLLKAIECSDATFYRIRNPLRSKGWIDWRKEGRTVYYRMTKSPDDP